VELQEELRLAGFQNDYFGVYSIDRLQPVKQIEENTDYVLAIAAYLGKARLIDNIILSK
jgi:pantoate--beta-alanine ligase